MSKVCPKCGHDNRDVAVYCGNCGERIITATPQSGNADDNSLAACCIGILLVLFVLWIIGGG